MPKATDETRIVNEATNVMRNANIDVMRKFGDYINPTIEGYRSVVV